MSSRAKRLTFKKCMEMMRRRDPQVQEDGFHALKPYAGEHVEELLQAFADEPDHGLQCWLLELLGETRSEKTIGLFSGLLTCSDEAFRGWAARGLHKLNTKEARTLLWNARKAEVGTSEETKRFRELLASLKQAESATTG